MASTPSPVAYLLGGMSPANCTEGTCPSSLLMNTTGYANCTGNCSTTEAPDEGNPFNLPWYLQLIYVVAFVSMVVVAAGGNIIVIWIVLANKRMRTVTNYFLLNLAVADALISIFNTLFNFVYMLYQNWPFGKNYCKFVHFISPCAISASVFTFMAIAIDRYIAIIHPLRPRMSAKTVLGVIGVIWLVAVFVASPAAWYGLAMQFPDGRWLCVLWWPDGVYSTTDLAYSVFLILVNYVVPLVILAGTYFCIGRELWGSRAIGEYTSKQEGNVKSKRRVVKMMIVVVVIFGVCWLPQHLYFIITNLNEHITNNAYIQHVYLVIYWVAMSNSMYNPIIYCWMNARFRRGFQYVFRWIPCVHYRSVHEPTPYTAGTSVRMSVSESAKFERNGSMMHTMVESLADDPSEYPSPSSGVFHKGFTRVKGGGHMDENVM